MLFSENKLRELANLDKSIKTDDIVEAINSIGFEVESVEKFNKNKGLKFGHVLNTYKNPNSEKLIVCEMEFSDKKRTIQTAATNVKKGDYVIAFVPGSIINGQEIKAKEMGKIVSEGMLASFSELGFNGNLLPKEMNEGILILNKVDLSLDPIKHFELEDNIIDVSILSNRSDAQSYQVFARELAAYFHKQVNKKKSTKKEFNNSFKTSFKLKSSNNTLLNGVEVENNKSNLINIKDIFLLLKTNIKIEESQVENFANLVLIYTGVSTRIFDTKKISKNIKIDVEKSVAYLSDGKNNISILGVEEIKEFKANDESKNILFEFSQIDTKTVRDNSKAIKKVTNSSINSSRAISSGSIKLAHEFISNHFDKCSSLINETTKNEKILFNKSYLNDYAGFDITKEKKYKEAIKSLEILGFQFSKYISYPETRHDIKNMQNIVEDIFRFYGMNNFDLSLPESNATIVKPINPIEKIISSLGYTQAWTYTLMSKEKNKFNPFEFKTINLKTYVSEEYDSIRNSISLTMLNVYEYNSKRKIEKASLFDVGMINDKRAILISSNTKSFKEIKSDIQKIANQKFQVLPLENEWLHPNYNAGLYLGGNLVGWIGKFNPFKFNSDVIFAEILEECIYREPVNKFAEFDSDPLKERDVTFEIEKDYEHAMFISALESIEGVFSVKLLSTFKKDNKNRITYRILMDEKALEKFDSIDWSDKNKVLKF